MNVKNFLAQEQAALRNAEQQMQKLENEGYVRIARGTLQKGDIILCVEPAWLADLVKSAHVEPASWYCGCGHTNGINLATCAACGCDPTGMYRWKPPV